MAAGVPDAFYLDDPSDGASDHLLGEVGVQLRRGAAAASVATAGFDALADVAAPTATTAVLLGTEHTFPVASQLRVKPDSGSVIVDVRDSADAWIRIVLHGGDVLSLNANVSRRLPPAGTPVLVMPVWAADCDRESKQSTVRYAPRAPLAISTWGSVEYFVASSSGAAATAAAPAAATLGASMVARFAPGSAEEAAANVPHFQKPGTPHTREVVVELCASFYHLGWVTGTGGSISIRHGNRIFMAPSGVQKERMQPQDIFVLDTMAKEVYAPAPLAGKPRLKLSQCAPLFHHAFTLRKAGACIHTHDVHAVMCTLQNENEWRVTHQEMIKGIAGHGFLDECVVPIIENTPHECDLADSLEEAMRSYPRSNAVLVRRHGVYVWGSSWEAAKTQAECYHYLFDASVRMRAIGIDPGATPGKVTGGIGSSTAYGTDLAGTGGRKNRGDDAPAAAGAAAAAASGGAHAHTGSCCGGAAATTTAVAAATSSGFHGTAGTSSLTSTAAKNADVKPIAPLRVGDAKAVVLDIEGATTSIAFVTDTLFPYAAAHLDAYLREHWGSGELADDVAALAKQSLADAAAGLFGATQNAVSLKHVEAVKTLPVPPHGAGGKGVATAAATTPAGEAFQAILDNVVWQMEANRKTGALKQLQGHIWRAGYLSGALKGHVYEDTPAALRQWVAAGRKVYIYSSGSREAQRLLFGHSVAGDLRPLLSGYFDTSIGAKIEASSYAEIALTLGVDKPDEILFATDSIAEARAAAAAGLQVAVTDRPGNVALPAGHGFPVVTSLLDLVPAATATA